MAQHFPPTVYQEEIWPGYSWQVSLTGPFSFPSGVCLFRQISYETTFLRVLLGLVYLHNFIVISRPQRITRQTPDFDQGAGERPKISHTQEYWGRFKLPSYGELIDLHSSQTTPPPYYCTTIVGEWWHVRGTTMQIILHWDTSNVSELLNALAFRFNLWFKSENPKMTWQVTRWIAHTLYLHPVRAGVDIKIYLPCQLSVFLCCVSQLCLADIDKEIRYPWHAYLHDGGVALADNSSSHLLMYTSPCRLLETASITGDEHSMSCCKVVAIDSFCSGILSSPCPLKDNLIANISQIDHCPLNRSNLGDSIKSELRFILRVLYLSVLYLLFCTCSLSKCTLIIFIFIPVKCLNRIEA